TAIPVSAAAREPARFGARTCVSHDYRPVEKDLFGFCLTDAATCPIVRRVSLIPLLQTSYSSPRSAARATRTAAWQDGVPRHRAQPFRLWNAVRAKCLDDGRGQ